MLQLVDCLIPTINVLSVAANIAEFGPKRSGTLRGHICWKAVSDVSRGVPKVSFTGPARNINDRQCIVILVDWTSLNPIHQRVQLCLSLPNICLLWLPEPGNLNDQRLWGWHSSLFPLALPAELQPPTHQRDKTF